MASCLRLTRISTAGIPTAADIPAFDCLPPSIESPNSPSTADSTGTTSSDSEPGQSPVLLRPLAKLRLDRQSKPADRPRPTRGYDEDDSAPDFDGNYLFTGYSTNSSSESPSPAHSPAAEQSDSIAQKNKGAIFFFRSLTGELRPEVRLLTAKVCQRPVLKRGQSDKASAASLRFDSAYPSTSASDSEREDGRKRTCGRRVRFSDQESEFEQSTSTKERTGQGINAKSAFGLPRASPTRVIDLTNSDTEESVGPSKELTPVKTAVTANKAPVSAAGGRSFSESEISDTNIELALNSYRPRSDPWGCNRRPATYNGKPRTRVQQILTTLYPYEDISVPWTADRPAGPASQPGRPRRL